MVETNGIYRKDTIYSPRFWWSGPDHMFDSSRSGFRKAVGAFGQPVYLIEKGNRFGIATEGETSSIKSHENDHRCWAILPEFGPEDLGDPTFKEDYRVRYAYQAGAMANGIASEKLVIELGKAGYLGSFGAAGLSPDRVEAAIHKIQTELDGRPYAFNLIHSPAEPQLERQIVDLYLRHGVRTVEASAFFGLTPNIVYYRAAGLERDENGGIVKRNKVIVKLSRGEVAEKFMQPAPSDMLQHLVSNQLISSEQAEMCAQISVADDVTVEADSGGHTDNRPLVSLLPFIMEIRDSIQTRYRYTHPIRVGAGGGIGTPQSAIAAFMMGASYVVTGSINQSSLEAGTSEHTKHLLAKADMADVVMTPAADMFERGVKVQVLKNGTMYPMRAQKLYDLYRTYDSLESIPVNERDKLVNQFFRKDFEAIWKDAEAFFHARDPSQIRLAEKNSKRKMALIFRWYLGQSSHWANVGDPDRTIDYQIWCGQSMGAFNNWVRNSYLENLENRHVTHIAREIMNGAAYLFRLRMIGSCGLQMPSELHAYKPGTLIK